MRFVISAFLLMFCVVPISARTITVDDDGPADFNNIQAAIDDANDYDVVLVSDGLYRGEGNRNIDAGDSNGNHVGIVVCSENGPINCIIDGNQADYGFYFDAITYNHNLPISHLEGFTITNYGTAIRLHQPCGVPNIKNCILTGNSGFCSGIACLELCTMEITDCVITNNNGRGIFCFWGAQPIITNCTITNNGGGIYCDIYSEPMFKNCLIAGNKANLGGGVYIYYQSAPIISNCLITGNRANSGGGLYATDDSEPEIINCTISGNNANTGGAVTSIYSSICKIKNSIIWNNTADDGDYIYRGKIRIDLGYVETDYSILQSSWSGTGNLCGDPCFIKQGFWVDVNDSNIIVEPNDSNAVWVDGDFHLQSEAGRWDPNSQCWVTDVNTSVAIDAGDPDSDWTAELWPHGKCINMGAYGGTPQASMSLSDVGNIADLDNNGYVDYNDMRLFTDEWINRQILLPEDLDRDGDVNFIDYAIFADNWKWEE